MDQAVFAWTGKFLRIDLTHRTIETDETTRYTRDYIGGRGICSRIAWEELSRGVTAFSDKNVLILMTGPLTGTTAPYSGRTTLGSLAPQGYPVEWYTRSSFGGHWGPALKYAGWDGLVISGKADRPVYLHIENCRGTIEDASPLHGLGIFETQKQIMARHGLNTRVFAIGPSGEHLSRIAIAATETESASGQGGFGAIMGSKNLKAISVRGSGTLAIARPEEFYRLCRLIRDEAHGSHGWPHPISLDPEKVKRYGQRFQACTQQCQTGCFDARYYTKVPGVMCKKFLAGQVDCVAGLFPGLKDTFYNWELGFEAGFEVTQQSNDLGLNHWEILIGLMPWLRDCHRSGYINDINGHAFNLNDPWCWSAIFDAISHRRGRLGEALAEGTVRGAKLLGFGEEFLSDYFPCWGYAGHWDGHGDHINHIVFPFWLVAALQWAVDTRDPISSGHGYTQNIMNWSRINSPEHGISWESIMAIGAKIYGSSQAVDPRSGYEHKAFPAYWHNHRSVFKDSLPVDDQMFPRIYSNYTDDHFSRTGDIDGIDFEWHLLNAATGIDISQSEFECFAERVVNLERLLSIRLFDRSRQDDETLIPYYEKAENSINPLLGLAQGLDAQKFRKLLDEYYDLRGWDRITGRPSALVLEKLKLPKEGQSLPSFRLPAELPHDIVGEDQEG